MTDGLKDGLGCVGIYVGIILFSLLVIWISKFWPSFPELLSFLMFIAIVSIPLIWTIRKLIKKQYKTVAKAITLLAAFAIWLGTPAYIFTKIIVSDYFLVVSLVWSIGSPLLMARLAPWFEYKIDYPIYSIEPPYSLLDINDEIYLSDSKEVYIFTGIDSNYNLYFRTKNNSLTCKLSDREYRKRIVRINGKYGLKWKKTIRDNK